MKKVSSILNERLFRKERPKMTALAEKSSAGDLTSFSGVFQISKLSEKETDVLNALLQDYAPENPGDLKADLNTLSSLTAEVKAIHHQAVILHGERIKKAQDLLKRYREGAFTAWLFATYGNRQTPYNFLQYYEFYSQMPKTLHPQIESMPRQAIYTLASREVPIDKKEEFVRNFHGKTKQELLQNIRTLFPLNERDGRRENPGQNAILTLNRLISNFDTQMTGLTRSQKGTLLTLLNQLESLIRNQKER